MVHEVRLELKLLVTSLGASERPEVEVRLKVDRQVGKGRVRLVIVDASFERTEFIALIPEQLVT